VTAVNNRVVTIHADGSVRVWSTTKDAIRVTTGLNDPKKTLTFRGAVSRRAAMLIGTHGQVQLVYLDTTERRFLPDVKWGGFHGVDFGGDDGVAVLSVTINDRHEVIVFDVRGNKEYTRISLPKPAAAFRLLAKGDNLLIGADSSLTLWETRTGKLVRKVWQGQAPIQFLSVPADGKLALVGDRAGMTHAIDLSSGEERYQLDKPLDHVLSGFSISPSGAVGMVIWKGKQIILEFFDVASGRKLGRVDDAFKDCVITPVLLDDEHLLVVPLPGNKVNAFAIQFQ
jgi:WD40 repeat protein